MTLAQFMNDMTAAFPEREETIRALVTAAVAGEHAFILGPPGTGKSLLTRTLAGACNASFFDVLMTPFTAPEEVFGPVKLSALQQDRYVRAVDGYFPSAEVAFLDEIWKSNSSILNSLLTALNERVYHNDGKPQSIPLLTCVAASNELPEGPELDALYDRFLVRLVVGYIADDDAFRGLLCSPPRAPSVKIDLRAEQAKARAVRVTDATLDAIVALRAKARQAGFVVSDRRWMQCLSLLRASAHIAGRTETSLDDLEILECVLWRQPDERRAVTDLVQNSVDPNGAAAVKALDEAAEIVQGLASNAGSKDTYLNELGAALATLKAIEARIAAMTPGRKQAQARAAVQKHIAEVQRRAMQSMGMAA